MTEVLPGLLILIFALLGAVALLFLIIMVFYFLIRETFRKPKPGRFEVLPPPVTPPTKTPTPPEKP